MLYALNESDGGLLFSVRQFKDLRYFCDYFVCSYFPLKISAKAVALMRSESKESVEIFDNLFEI